MFTLGSNARIKIKHKFVVKDRQSIQRKSFQGLPKEIFVFQKKMGRFLSQYNKVSRQPPSIIMIN